MKRLERIFEEEKTRISGNGSFPAPQKKDIGREVVVTRQCITWDGCLGYFADDKSQTKVAFYLGELEEVKEECPNCQGENAKTGHVEVWDGVCPDCGREVG